MTLPLAMLALIVMGSPGRTEDGIPSVFVDGNRVAFDSSKPVLADGQVQLPLDKIAESLALELEFDRSTRRLELTGKRRAFSMVLGEALALKNRTEDFIVGAPPFLRADVVYVPLDFVSEALDAGVEWDPAANRVEIDSAERSDAKPLT
ncbi:MAG TPA: copper amine oxidase N-terminal domain-containing protein [Fimbriimonas sp.]